MNNLLYLKETILKRPTLHPDIFSILFENKKEVSRKLSDIRGIYNIDHVAITLIDPGNELTIFSLTPSVEFNLLINGLWEYDTSFFPSLYKDGTFLWWNDAYQPGYQDTIKSIKETNHNFSFGFSLIRKISDFQLIYSFATRNKEYLKTFYLNKINELFLLGDFGYQLISSIYSKYCEIYTPPAFINEGNTQFIKIKSPLKLIINRP